MIKLKNFKRVSVLLLLVIFLLVISWTVKFRFLSLEDLRILAILLVGTSILLLISDSGYSDKLRLLNKIRFNLFFVGMLMSLLLLYDALTSTLAAISLNKFFLSLKPMIFVLIVYLPIYNVLTHGVKDTKIDSKMIDLRKLLSRREKEVFDLLLKGMTNKEISSDLYIAENTVKKHVQNILKKLECTDRVSLMTKYESSEEQV